LTPKTVDKASPFRDDGGGDPLPCPAKPDSITHRNDRGHPYRINIQLPAGGSLGFSYQRTNRPPTAFVNILINNNGGLLNLAAVPNDANKLNASVLQDGPLHNLTIIVNFQGQ
jgi:hypothetical protein